MFGAHIFLHSHGDESLTARFSWMELRKAGQAFRMGRYPIHFHNIGNVRNSYIRYNSVHHTYNRGITIHGVHYLRVIGNVVYETMGCAIRAQVHYVHMIWASVSCVSYCVDLT